MEENKQTLLEEVLQLSSRLREYQKAYYVDNHPLVSDLEYDRFFDRLSNLEKEYPEFRFPDSPTQRVGSDLSSDFPEVVHSIPVLSLDKAYSNEAVLSWVAKSQQKMRQGLSYVIEEKIDGISMVLYYEKGLLVKAVTRGNGTVGNDVTANVKTIASIPLRLPHPDTLAVRGEVYLQKADFLKLNKSMEIPYANPRNLAAGTIRRIKSSEVAKVPLQMFVYEGFWEEGLPLDDHVMILSKLKEYGFRINPTIGLFCKTKEEAQKRLKEASLEGFGGSFSDIPSYIQARTDGRNALLYEIDGLVAKVNELAIREQFGYTSHHPRWAIAYKFESPQATTVVQKIDIQVGRTGRVTPVARVKPVLIGGSTVSNVTLHNQDYIDMLELAIGDTVEISKRGDVIPAVERVIEKNENGEAVWKMQDTCPSCQKLLVKNGAHTFCPNPLCPDQVKGRVAFFIGKAQMDIESFGPETASALLEKGLLKDVDDIYTIDYRKVLSDTPGFGVKKIEAIIEGVEKSKEQPFRRVLVSLGISEFGKKAADLLVSSGITSMDELLTIARNEDIERLVAIKQMGEKTARLLVDSLNDPSMQRRIEALRKAGLCFEESGNKDTGLEQVFAGQVWCVTGSFDHFNPRDLALEEIEKRGGRTVSSITGKTTHLLAGSGAGSKLTKAENLSVHIVNEEAFLDLIAEKQSRVKKELSKEELQGEFSF
ncbi:DNA ligase, NAD-dependent [Sphaerochaeta pleomorpha str. Grapes]|uniref:DNA ligase n=1 Tax=Sphaerochaeta pleomorpha (strain ATCC BAA-1885 / DSM 22778 / Grapes) TaxID=158190 RepID=G8QR09_SPHPG|nr:NAD-dependent DNA ligase LigA [Sphaerochaeta pleomorpha]AEV29857.1 DNA ligase, NAD-dependent [Sphaerochaeta pleomorpha str. Grapes]